MMIKSWLNYPILYSNPYIFVILARKFNFDQKCLNKGLKTHKGVKLKGQGKTRPHTPSALLGPKPHALSQL